MIKEGGTMANKATKLTSPRPASYELKLRKVGADGSASERTITSTELKNITPRGKAITASREEIVAALTKSAKHVKRQSSPVLEAAGAIRMRTAK